MRMYGIDFTSAPTRAKPITVAVGELGQRQLRLRQLLRIRDFSGFERSLAEPGPWIAVMDFPFGLPRTLVEDLHWPTDWPGCLDHVASLTRQEFEDRLLFYKAVRPSGRKELRRRTDVLAGALSPMKLQRVPLAKMFYEGTRRLSHSPLSIRPCRPTADDRTVLEGYPGLAARSLIGRRSYKLGDRGRQEQARHDARLDIVRALIGSPTENLYGFRVDIGDFVVEELIDDSRGDLLDAVLCMAQAAWAWSHRSRCWGIPEGCDPLEGWIVDPATVAA